MFEEESEMAPTLVNNLKRYNYFLIGILLLSILCGITILQGESSYITIHDQFDGEVFSTCFMQII